MILPDYFFLSEDTICDFNHPNMESSFDPELFMRPDGHPMVFLMVPGRSSCEVVRESIKTDVEARGGLVLDHRDSRFKDHIIHLLGKNEIPMRHQEMFDYRFVENCIYENMIVPNMIDYRILSCQTTVYESFNPLDILHGYVKWDDLREKIEGERVSDIEDFEDEESTFSESRTNNFKTYKIAYSRKNQEEIVKYLVRFSAYRLVKGRAIWEKLAELKICKGVRSWQSMKEHFRKKIISQIHTFGLSWRQVRRFRAAYGLDEVHDSDVDSDEEEGVDKESVKQINAKETFSPRDENPFLPRRTSSPFVNDAGSSKAMQMSSNDGGNILTEEVEDVIERDETDAPSKISVITTMPARRKRKLFSTSCSYLDDGDGKQVCEVTPVKRTRIVNEVIEEANEEINEDETEDANTEGVNEKNEGTTSILGHIDPLNNDNSLNAKAKVSSKVSENDVAELDGNNLDIDSNTFQNIPKTSSTEQNIADTLEEIFGPSVSPLPPAKRKSKRNTPNKYSYCNSDSSFDSEDRLNDNLETNKCNEDAKAPDQAPESPATVASENVEIISQTSGASQDPHNCNIDTVTDSIPDVIEAGSNSEPDAVNPRSSNVAHSKTSGGTSPKSCLTPPRSRGRRMNSHSSSGSSGYHRSPSPRKVVINTPTSVCCRKINTVDVDAMETLQFSKKIAIRRKSGNTTEVEKISNENVEKENLDKDYWYRNKFRQLFSRGEDEAIVNYFLKNGGYSVRGGNSIWRKMEEEWICPGRTWHSLRERFEKYIEINLKLYGTSISDLLQVDNQNNISKGVRGTRKNCNYYSKDEDLKIIQFIIDNKRFDDVKGNELWKVLEERNVLKGRTWQSMKERFRKVIVNKLNQYKINSSDRKQFEKRSNSKKEKRIN